MMCSFIGNQLQHHLEEWVNIGASSEVLNWISNGVNIPFKNIPSQFSFQNKAFKRHEAYFIRSELKRLVKAKCIKKVDAQPVGVSPISVVPKKNNECRL